MYAYILYRNGSFHDYEVVYDDAKLMSFAVIYDARHKLLHYVPTVPTYKPAYTTSEPFPTIILTNEHDVSLIAYDFINELYHVYDIYYVDVSAYSSSVQRLNATNLSIDFTKSPVLNEITFDTDVSEECTLNGEFKIVPFDKKFFFINVKNAELYDTYDDRTYFLPSGTYFVRGYTK